MIQSRTARLAVGHPLFAFSWENLKAACEFLRAIDLRPIGATDGPAFSAALNRKTKIMMRALPRRARR